MRTQEQVEAMVPMSDRSAQRFPRLSEKQLGIVKRFADAEARSFSPGEPIFEVGDQSVPAWFLLEGSADLFGRDGLEQEIALRELESGQFTGELHELAGRPTLSGARAGADGCVALPLDAVRLRALIVGSAELGELIMRAFILRRVGLLERGVGPVLLGRAGSAELLRLEAFLTRNTIFEKLLFVAHSTKTGSAKTQVDQITGHRSLQPVAPDNHGQALDLRGEEHDSLPGRVSGADQSHLFPVAEFGLHR
jgi:thioredoxin reductase (NADPH)